MLNFICNRPAHVALSVALSAMMCGNVVAAPKPDPGEVPAEPAGGETGAQKPDPSRPGVTKPSAQLKADFEAACEKDNFPKVLMMVAQDARAQGRAPTGTRDGQTTGTGAGGAGVGSIMMDFDRTGLADMVESGLGVYLQDGFGEFVDPSSLADAARTEIVGKLTRDEEDGIATMAQKLNADICIYIRMQELPAAERGPHGERFRCFAEIKHLRRRSSTKVVPFDWDGPVDPNTLNRKYAGPLAIEFMEAYIKMVNRGVVRRAFSVRIENLPASLNAAEIVRLFSGIEGMKGTPKVDDLNQNPINLNDVDMTINFVGESFDLEAAVKKAATEKGLTLTTSRQESGRLIMSAEGAVVANPVNTCWFFSTEPGNEQQKKVTDMIKRSPGKLAVVVNWMLDPDQAIADRTKVRVDATPWTYSITSTHDPVGQMGGDPRLKNNVIGNQTVVLEQLQNTIGELFADAGLFVVDANAVSSALDKQRAKLEQLGKDRRPEQDVMTVLKNSEGYDYIIWAKAQVRTVGQLKNENTAKYSFTLYDVKSGRLLGAVSWDGTDQEFTKSEIKGIPKKTLRETKSSDIVARYIAGNLMCKWANKTPFVEFEVYGAAELGEVDRFYKAIDGRVESATLFGLGYDNGVGRFTCGFDGSAESLKTSIEKIASEYDGRKGKVTEVQANKIIFTFDK